jgi:phospholipase C
VPTIIISPWAKRGFVDHTAYDTTSILRFIEWRWSLPPLGTRDANANNLLAAFDFSQPAPPTARNQAGS